MALEQLQSIVRRLANGRWTRYWVNWSDSCKPKMAIQCRDPDGKPVKVHDAESHGLEENPEYVYTAQRTNDDGTPYDTHIGGP